MNTKTLRIAAATSLLSIGVALVAFGASAATCTSTHTNEWGVVHSCIKSDGSIPGGVSGSGTGAGKSLAVELIAGTRAVGWGVNQFGLTIPGCTATDTTMDGTSVYDYSGCGLATGTKVQVTY
jgi:hypothetical protein